MNRIPRFKRSPLFYFTLLCFVISVPGTAQEIGLISVAGEAVPSYLLRVGEGLVSSTVEELTGGTVLSGRQMQALQDSGAAEREVKIDIAGCTDLDCARQLAGTLDLAAIAIFSLEKQGGGYRVIIEAVRADGSKRGRAEEFFIDIRNYDATVAETGRNLLVQMGLAAALVTEASGPDSPVSAKESPDETASSSEPVSAAEVTETAEDEKAPEQSGVSETSPPETDILPPVPIDSGSRLFIAGIALYQLGGLANMLALMSGAERVSSDYLARSALSSSEKDSYETAEELYRTAYTISSAVAWTLHASAPVSAGFPLFGRASEDLKFSYRGKWYLYGGIGSAVAGHLLYLDSIDSLVESSYLRARGESSSYYSEEFDREFPWVIARQGAVIGLWTLGSAAVMAAPAQPGDREPLTANFWDRVLVGSGLALFSGGNVLASLAGMRRTEALENWYDYQNVSSSSRYSDWEESFDNFELNRNIALGLWLGGAFCLALAEMADFPDPFASRGKAPGRDAASKETPEASLRFLPLPDGGSLFLHFAFQ